MPRDFCRPIGPRRPSYNCGGEVNRVKHYLNTYAPLVHNRFGREACRVYGHPRFVDASCRREPDLESSFPSISALCRAQMFAPRLHVGDRVIYMTKKGSAERGVRHLGELN
jgi:hypothetical protein